MRAKWWCAAPVFLLALPAPASAEEAGDGWSSLGARVSGRTGVWTHDRQLGGEGLTALGAIRGEVAPRLSDKLDLRLAGWVQVDTARGRQADLTEANLRARLGPLEILAGRDIAVWGRADRLNPTDVISSRDYRLLVADDDEQRRGSAMARLRLGMGPFTLDGYWLPEFRPNRFPRERAQPGVQFLAEQKVKSRNQFALKLDRSGGSVDWSVGLFDGRDRTRDFTPAAPTLTAPPGTRLAVQETYPRVRVLGGDVATTAGKVGLRAEVAWSNYLGRNSPFRKQDNAWTILGMDTTLAGGWNVNLQYSFRTIFDFAPIATGSPSLDAVAVRSAAVNNRLDRHQHGLTFRLAKGFRNETLQTELATVVYLDRTNAALRPKVSYAIDDQLRATLGADVFLGPRLSYFGQVRSLSALYLQLSYSR